MVIACKQAKRTGTAVTKAPTAKAETGRTTMTRGLKPASASAGDGPRSKRALLVERLGRPEGARIDDLIKDLGWLPHTVRAALTGLRRKGYVVAREKAKDGSSVYRATPPAGQNVSTSPTVKKAPRAASKRAA